MKKETLTALITAAFSLCISEMAKAEDASTSSRPPHHQATETDLLMVQHHECGKGTCESDSGGDRESSSTPGGASEKITDD